MQRHRGCIASPSSSRASVDKSTPLADVFASASASTTMTTTTTKTTETTNNSHTCRADNTTKSQGNGAKAVVGRNVSLRVAYESSEILRTGKKIGKPRMVGRIVRIAGHRAARFAIADQVVAIHGNTVFRTHDTVYRRCKGGT